MRNTLERRSAATAGALCADVSQEHAEALAATASRVDHWMLVEYRHLWSRDILRGSGLPEEAKEHLRAELAALPNSRLLFIRRPDRRAEGTIAVYYGRSLEAEQRFFRLELAGYDELAEIDFVGALRGGGPARGDGLEHPLLVVCTHGKRDRCCAKYGRPLYDELREQADPEWVWQSTHVGGDRFAGNVVCLPEGLYFGRVERPDVWPLLDDYLAGRISLEHYRGRSCYTFVVQAAEREVREATGLAGFADVRLLGCDRTDDDAWTVRLRAEPTGDVHVIDVIREIADEPAYLTCTAPRPERARRHRATAHRVEPAP